MTARNKKTYYAHVSIDGKEFTEVVEGENITVADVRKFLKDKGYTVEKIVSSETHHLCKYCKSIAEGTYDDLLCDECREVFGHSLYSEL